MIIYFLLSAALQFEKNCSFSDFLLWATSLWQFQDSKKVNEPKPEMIGDSGLTIGIARRWSTCCRRHPPVGIGRRSQEQTFPGNKAFLLAPVTWKRGKLPLKIQLDQEHADSEFPEICVHNDCKKWISQLNKHVKRKGENKTTNLKPATT